MLLAIMVLLAIGFGFLLGFPGLTIGGFNPDSQQICGLHWAGFGQYPDVPGDRTKIGEFFSRDKTYLSWTQTGTSIPFSVAGHLKGCSTTLSQTAEKARYTFEINNGIGGLQSFRFDD